jgi:hypothetical protein
MKQKFFFLVLLFGMIQLAAFSQDTKPRKTVFTPLVSEDDIRNIMVEDNIDLVIVQSAEAEKVNISIAQQNYSKLKVKLYPGGVSLSTEKKLATAERLTVYATVFDLESLSLSGSGFAMSRGVLDSKFLQVNLNQGARVAIRSNGRVQVNSDGAYQISKGNNTYSSVFATE